MKMKRIDTINVIPFIDIMLVLLVMVLTTSTFIKTGQIPVNLPIEKSNSSIQNGKNEKDFNIIIKLNGDINLNDSKKINLNDLEKKLLKMDKSINIVLYTDKKTEFQNFVDVMNVIKKVGHENLFIVTDKIYNKDLG